MLGGCSKGSSQDHNLGCNHNDEALIQSPDVLSSVMKESHHPGPGQAPDSSIRILYRERKNLRCWASCQLSVSFIVFPVTQYLKPH